MASYTYKKNGNVKITITHGKRIDGKPARYYKEVKYVNQKQLEADTALFLSEILENKVTAGSSMTVRQLFQRYINVYAKDNELEATTTSRYEVLYEHQIDAKLGTRKLTSITKADINEWVRWLKEDYVNPRTQKHLAEKTIKHAYNLLSSLFNYAIDELEVIDSNPCARKGKKRISTKEEKRKKQKELVEMQYSEIEIMQLLSALLDERKQKPELIHIPVLLFIIFTGVRTNEIMGLRWENVDFERNRVVIVEGRTRDSYGNIVSTMGKTINAEREISVPSFIMDMFKEIKEQQYTNCSLLGVEHQGYVVSHPDGKPLRTETTYKYFQKFLARNGFKKTTVHNLRHTHVALLSHLGIGLNDISERLGHANPKITAEQYWYLFKKDDGQVSEDLGNYYSDLLIKIRDSHDMNIGDNAKM